jgi:signal transduction histidine kinase
MELRSKQSEGSATASDHKVFFWARLKLTGTYVFILVVILLGFSITLYQNLERNLLDASDDDFSGIESHHHFVQNTLADVENEIILIDLIILIAAAGASYILAGYTLRPIQASMEAQRMFSENASHELRTPLAVMKNDMEVLLRNPNPAKDLVHKTLRSNIEEIDDLSQMAGDLLRLARSQNMTRIPKDTIDISSITTKIGEKMQPIASKKEITLRISQSGLLLIYGNVASIERILINLIQNAIDHTLAGGTVVVDVQSKGSSAIIEVSDTGTGISEKDLPHIFNRFYKGESASGSGLGLSIVKELINQHAGDVSIKSTKGVGTVVTITLPAVA